MEIEAKVNEVDHWKMIGKNTTESKGWFIKNINKIEKITLSKQPTKKRKLRCQNSEIKGTHHLYLWKNSILWRNNQKKSIISNT